MNRKKLKKSKEKSVLRLVNGLAGARFPVDSDIATEQVKQARVCLERHRTGFDGNGGHSKLDNNCMKECTINVIHGNMTQHKHSITPLHLH